MITKFRLYESPDSMAYKGLTIRYDMYDSHPIGYLKDYENGDYINAVANGNQMNMDNGFVLGYEFGIHPNIVYHFLLDERGYAAALGNFTYAGRLWALNIPDEEYDNLLKKADTTQEELDLIDDIFNDVGDNWGDWDVASKLKDEGYDSIYAPNGEIVVFDPEQITILEKIKLTPEKIAEVQKIINSND